MNAARYIFVIALYLAHSSCGELSQPEEEFVCPDPKEIDEGTEVNCGGKAIVGTRKQGAIDSETVADNSLSNEDFDDSSIDSRTLSKESVTGEKISSEAVEEKHIQNKSISSDKIKDSAIVSSSIAGGAIDNSHLATGAAITDDKLDTITTAGKVSGSAITSGIVSGTTEIDIAGPIASSGNFTVKSNGTIATELRLEDDDGSNFLGFRAPGTVAGNILWTLPAADGVNGQVLQTDGSGALNWANAAADTNANTVCANGQILDGDGTCYTRGALSALGAVGGGVGGTITDASITNDDISGSAAIADSKLATISTAGKVSGSAITSGTIGGSTVVTTTGALTSSGNITAKSTGAAATDLRLEDNDGSNYVGFKAPGTVGSNIVWQLPAADGAVGEVLTSNNDGTLSWTAKTVNTNTNAQTVCANGQILDGDGTCYTRGALSALGAVGGGVGGTITDASITNDDISGSAAIADSKLATISTAGKVSGSAITSGTIGGSTVVTTTGALTSSGNITAKSTGAAATDLRLEDNDGSNYVGFKAPGTVGSNIVWQLPAADGAVGEVLTSNNDGTLSWTAKTVNTNTNAQTVCANGQILDGDGTCYTRGALSALGAVGGGVGGTITDGSITKEDLAADSVEAAEIASNAVGANEIATGAVGSDEISNGSVALADINQTICAANQILVMNGTGTALVCSSISADNLATDSVDGDEIATNAVGSTEISTGAVGADEIATGAVGADEIATNAVASDEIATGAVGSDEISNGSIALADLSATICGANQMLKMDGTGTSLVCGSVTADQLATDSVASDEIAASAVTSSELADDAVTLAKIAPNGCSATNIIKSIDGSTWGCASDKVGVDNSGGSTDHAVARFNGTGGKDIQDSSVTIDDSGNIVTTADVSSSTVTVSSLLAMGPIPTDKAANYCDGGTNDGDIWMTNDGTTMRMCLNGNMRQLLGSSTTHTIFITSTEYDGATVGGVSGADAKCAARAVAAGLPQGEYYRAIISTSTVDARDRIFISGDTVNTNGDSIISAGQFWAAVNRDNAIDYDETGTIIVANKIYFTGTTVTGTYEGSGDCSAWTSTTGSAASGKSDQSSNKWVNEATYGCSLTNHLMCISQ